MPKRIFQYITEHLDEDGKYTEATLPDIPITTVPRVLGEIEAAFYISEEDSVRPNNENAQKLISLLNDYLAIPSPERRKKLYDEASNIPIASIADYFCDHFEYSHMNDTCFDLACTFFYNAQNREPIKFAYLLFGIYGMERIHTEDKGLWQDLLTCAHCEEFTFFFFHACRHSDYEPQREYWHLLGCTEGWGKVFALLDIEAADDAQRLWLVKHGMELKVEYASLSIKLIIDSRLPEFLQQDAIDRDSFKGALSIANNFLVFLAQLPANLIAEQFNLELVELPKLLHNLLCHAEKMTQDYTDYLDVMALTLGLRNLASENNWNQLTPQETNQLLAAFDKIVYRLDWQKVLDEDLIKDDVIDLSLCDMSFELEIDIWEQVYEYWLAHPLDFKLFPYLLPYEGEHRSERVLNEITRLLPLYATHEDALLIPLRYLRQFPGTGETIVYAGLTGLFDWPRGVACVVLEAWGAEFITPHLREGLHKALKLSNNNVIDMRISALLKNEEFSLD